MVVAERVLRRVQGIAICRLTSADVVRHPLVARIVDAYAQQSSRRTAPDDDTVAAPARRATRRTLLP